MSGDCWGIDLNNAAAIEKLRQLAQGIDFAMLATALADLPIHMVPMSTGQQPDLMEQGELKV